MLIVSALWLPASLLAGLLQAWRTAIQQRLRAQLTISGAGLVRYAYGAPIALVMVLAYFASRGLAVPHLSWRFLLFAGAGGCAQILGTNALITAFGQRGFVVGTAFSKTEAMQAALFSAVIFGERLHLLVWLGILLGVSGVALMGFRERFSASEVLRTLGQKGAVYGFAAGALFALTGVLVKQATLASALSDKVAAALVTLLVVNTLQTLMHGTWVALREPATLLAILRSWRVSWLVGLLSSLGSACWFTGFAIAPVALVRVVGQVEVFFTLGFGHFYLREKIRTREALALLLVGGGVVLALLGAR